MEDGKRTREQLKDELDAVRQRVVELEALLSKKELSDGLFQTLINASPVGMYIVQDGKFTIVNSRFQEITGYRENELLGMYSLDIVFPEDREMMREKAVKMLKKERSSPYEFRVFTKEGQIRWIMETVTSIQYLGKRAALGNFMDITDLKKARELLRESEQRYRMLIQHSVEAIYLFDPETKKVLEGNPSFMNLLGYREEELSRLLIYDFIAHDKGGIDSYIESIMRAGAITLEDRAWRRKDGTLIDIHLTANKVREGGRDIIFVVARDITERKRAERRLKENQELLDNILSASPVGIGMFEQTALKWENPALLDLFGIEKGEYTGKDARILFPSEEEYNRVESIFLKWLPQGKPVEIDTKFKRKDGSVFDGHLKMSSFDPSDPLDKVIATISDITWRKESEAALNEEKERLSVTLRSIGDGVISTDGAGNIVLMNRVAEELTGWSEDEAIGRPLNEVFNIINEVTRERCDNPVEKVLETGGLVGLANHTVLVSKDGTERILADSGAPILARDGKVLGVVLVFRDVTEARRIDRELQKMEKLESVGVLAGGIAHDLNNILMGILGNIALAKMYAEPDDKVIEKLAEAERVSLRAKGLTQQLLTFSKGGAPIKKTTSIRELLKESVSFALRGSNVRCEFFLSDDLWPVEIDEGQMNQVINNLVINAQQAMPEGGIFEVRAENAAVGKGSGLPLNEGKYIKITIEDHGIGISKEHLLKIFDPYFTTKQKGSGLGLTTAYSIIKNHDGYIRVESELGEGTRFDIYLPASEEKVVKKEAVEEMPPAGKGRILLMDDEEIVVDVAREMLESLGYEVECARDGAETIEVFKNAKESGNAFDAVIMDLTIPGGMGGKEAIKKLLEIDPGVRAIVSSGYSNDPVMSDFRKYGFRGVMAKPCKIKELGEVIYKAITEPDQPDHR